MTLGTPPTRHPASYVDPAGQLYLSDQSILRGIKPDFADFYSSLLDDSLIAQLNGNLLVKTQIASESLDGYGLTLWHEPITPASYCYEWHPAMLKDAALLVLDLCEQLVERNLTLQDAYPWNVLFKGTRPVFVDFTSIVPSDVHLLWVAYDQFCRFFLFPLALHACRPGRLVRALLTDYISGVSDSMLLSMLPVGATLRMPWLIQRVHIPRAVARIVNKLSDPRRLNAVSERLKPSQDVRVAFFRSLRRHIESIRLHGRRSRWSSYYADYFNDVQAFFQPEAVNRKHEMVQRILETIRPETVTDVGCNVGGYSILAARSGARVISLDSDDDSVGLLYQLAKEKQLNIHPLVIDVLNPSPAMGWRAMQFSAANTRLRSRMVFALALVHHLSITQRQTFERIVLALNDFTDQWLLTEFVPISDPRVVELTATVRRDLSWYTLENFIRALEGVFSSIETFPSHPEGRTLILCGK